MMEKVGNFLGITLAYSAMFIGSYEIAIFAINRVAYIIEAGKGIFEDKGEVKLYM